MKHPIKPAHRLPRSIASIPAALKRSTAVLAAILAASFLAGCEDSRHDHVYVAPPQPDFFVELEPNDTPDFPDFVSVLDDRSFLVVEGHVDAVGFDIVDHIEFESDRPIEIDFTLEAFGAFGDVDVTIYDPIANEIVGTYAIDGHFEVGTLVIHEAGRPFQFIIEAFDTDSPWSLELVAYPHGCACRTQSGPGDAAALEHDHSAEVKAYQESLPPFVAKREHEILRPKDNAQDAVEDVPAGA